MNFGGLDLERFRNPDLDHLETAKGRGDYRPLAEHIRAGGTLHPETRDWLAKCLLDELPSKKMGRKRTRADERQDFSLFWKIVQLKRAHACTRNKAVELYARESGKNLDSVKTVLRRAEKAWGKVDQFSG